MKKINKIFLSLALVLILVIPMFAGCSLSDLFGDNSVKVNNEGKTIASIEIKGNIKTEYYAYEAIDFNGAELKVNYEDNTASFVSLKSSMVSGFDTTTFGEKQMTITYNNNTCDLSYEVKFKLGRYKGVSSQLFQNNSLMQQHFYDNPIYYVEFVENGKYYDYLDGQRQEAIDSDNNGRQCTWTYSGEKLCATYYNALQEISFTSETNATWTMLFSSVDEETQVETNYKQIVYLTYSPEA